MSDWKIIVPEATTNLVTNPSMELGTAGWTWGANAQGAGYGRVAGVGRFGAYGGTAVCTGTNNRAIQFGSFTRGANDNITLLIWARSDSGTSQLVLRLTAGGTDLVDSAIFSVTTAWQELTLTVADATMDAWAGGGLTLYALLINDADNGVAKTWHFDALQGEAKLYATTHCDGDQDGCEWNGAPHASTSTRSAQSRAGGRVRDLDDDYSFYIERMVDVGMAPVTQYLDEYALIPGGQVQGVKVRPRAFALQGAFQSRTSQADLHLAVQNFLNVVKPDGVPGNQPVTLRYTGGTETKEIAAYYEGGLEAQHDARSGWWLPVTVRFLAADPAWYEVGESAAALDTNDTTTFRYVAGRLKSTGQWSALGLTANPTTGGTIYAIAYNPINGLVYVGGQFTGLNGVAGRNYIAAYDPTAGTWSTVGAGSAIGGIIRAIAIAPNGDVYIGGEFIDVADANGDYIAYYDISAAAWASVAGGGSGPVYALAFDQNGLLYIGGIFTDWNSVGAADYICTWNGSAYAPLGTGMNNDVVVIKIGKNNVPYVGGVFTTGNGVTLNRIGYWNGSTFVAMGTGTNSNVFDIAIDSRDRVHVVGSFTTADGVTVNRAARWNGSTFESLGSGLNSGVYGLTFGPDDMLYAVGAFTTAGGLTLPDRMARWNGSSWAALDVDLPSGVGDIRAVICSKQDAVILSSYDIWIGCEDTGAGYMAGKATVTNSGTAAVYPRIEISRTTGTMGRITSVRNETTGKELLFDYSLLDGETLTVDLTPTQKSVASSFFGPRPDAVLPNCDFGTFALQPGANDVTAFVNVTGAPTITANVIWRDSFWSLD